MKATDVLEVFRAEVSRSSAETKIAQAAQRLFRTQEQEAENGKTKFTTWNTRAMAMFLKPLSDAYLAAAKRAKGDIDANTLATAAKAHAMDLAEALNQTTGEWVKEGREGTFDESRAVGVGLTEASRVENNVTKLSAQSRGKSLKWVAERNACPECRSLHGKKLVPGKSFVTKSGTAVEAPPLHPNCRCIVKEA